ncbi:hypothetical protein CRBSH125_31110 [Afipia carboxidovorans]|nr:hypothetical protein CRBSH125_31110 [Afipia carboxidovorans]
MSGAAGAGFDVFDAIIGDDGAVVAGGRAQNLDAILGSILNNVLRDQEAERIDADDRGSDRLADGGAANIAGARLQPDGVAAASENVAIGDMDVAAGLQADKASPLRQVSAAAIERQPGEDEAVRALGGEEGGAAGEFDPCCAARADDLRAARQIEFAGTIDSGRSTSGVRAAAVA